MKVEILSFDGCPSYAALMPRLRELMGRAGVDAPVELNRVESVEVAERERFLGSPTLRIDNQDVDPAARADRLRTEVPPLPERRRAPGDDP